MSFLWSICLCTFQGAFLPRTVDTSRTTWVHSLWRNEAILIRCAWIYTEGTEGQRIWSSSDNMSSLGICSRLLTHAVPGLYSSEIPGATAADFVTLFRSSFPLLFLRSELFLEISKSVRACFQTSLAAGRLEQQEEEEEEEPPIAMRLQEEQKEREEEEKHLERQTELHMGAEHREQVSYRCLALNRQGILKIEEEGSSAMSQLTSEWDKVS